MKIEFAFFRPGIEGRPDSALEFEMSAVPRPGDQIVIRQPKATTETFRVRRTVWCLRSPVHKDVLEAHGPKNKVGVVDIVTVECEPEHEDGT
jgi:hypothetical protein